MSNDTTVQEEREPVVGPALKSAAHKTGAALHVAGSKVADANLRQVGKAFKRLGQRMPKVRIERA